MTAWLPLLMEYVAKQDFNESPHSCFISTVSKSLEGERLTAQAPSASTCYASRTPEFTPASLVTGSLMSARDTPATRGSPDGATRSPRPQRGRPWAARPFTVRSPPARSPPGERGAAQPGPPAGRHVAPQPARRPRPFVLSWPHRIGRQLPADQPTTTPGRPRGCGGAAGARPALRAT